jgi:hypothetical protein
MSRTTRPQVSGATPRTSIRYFPNAARKLSRHVLAFGRGGLTMPRSRNTAHRCGIAAVIKRRELRGPLQWQTECARTAAFASLSVAIARGSPWARKIKPRCSKAFR